MKTGKVLVEGEPVVVEAIVSQMRECFDITYQSKTVNVPLAKGKVRCWLQVAPSLTIAAPTDPKED